MSIVICWPAEKPVTDATLMFVTPAGVIAPRIVPAACALASGALNVIVFVAVLVGVVSEVFQGEPP